MPRTIDPLAIRTSAARDGVYILSPDPHVAAAEGDAILELASSGQIVRWHGAIEPNAAIEIHVT